MLKRMVTVLLIAVFALTAMPVILDTAEAASKKVTGFQNAYDNLGKNVGRSESKPLWTIFQDSSDYMHKPVANVKRLSLRNNKMEVLRRRMGMMQ